MAKVMRGGKGLRTVMPLVIASRRRTIQTGFSGAFACSRTERIGGDDEWERRAHYACGHSGGPKSHYRAGAAHADAAGAETLRAHRRRSVREIRKFTGHQF